MQDILCKVTLGPSMWHLKLLATRHLHSLLQILSPVYTGLHPPIVQTLYKNLQIKFVKRKALLVLARFLFCLRVLSALKWMITSRIFTFFNSRRSMTTD